MFKTPLIALAAGLIAANVVSTTAMAQMAPQGFHGRSTHHPHLTPASPPGRGCLTTIDRVREERVWDPLCDKWGGGPRPGLGD
jgi:hypothetical protein